VTGGDPFLLLRVRVRPEARARFEEWFRTAHVTDALKIPGLVGIRSGTTAGGTRIACYMFESAESVSTALQSPQAAFARGSLERWTSELEELRVEMFSALSVIPIYHAIN
jgi:hypothetical protein